ncbi:hypothetical protein OSL52_25445, partial [Escherichia coli]|nr:hypothetical protein [Escherichia coli]
MMISYQELVRTFPRNYPCSGKKGGVSHCTSDGKFVCNDGTIREGANKQVISSQADSLIKISRIWA